MENSIRFSTVKQLAICIAELVRQGVTFKAWQSDDGFFWVELTGGC